MTLALTFCALWFAGIILMAICMSNATFCLWFSAFSDAFWDWAEKRMNINEREW